MQQMKLTVGMGSIDEYEPYVKAGADEIFCGYVPAAWMEKYGVTSSERFTPLNRREVRYYNVQIGSHSELKILGAMQQDLKVPVTLTFNSLWYGREQYPVLLELLESCMDEGFASFIIADPELLQYLHQQGVTQRCHIALSGEVGEVNRYMIRCFKELGIRRVIFHRKTSLTDMAACIAAEPDLEYEAFLLNEKCHYHGGFCFSCHRDELPPMCRVPYRLRRTQVSEIPEPEEKALPEFEGIGSGGCGLCALWQLRRAGVTHLKLVSRGNYVDATMQDIAACRHALDLLEKSDSEQAFIRQLQSVIFPQGCSGNCYYLEACDIMKHI